MTKEYLKELVYAVNGAATEVHKSLGHGLLESVYHSCMKHEMELRGIHFASEYNVPVTYKGIGVQAGFTFAHPHGISGSHNFKF